VRDVCNIVLTLTAALLLPAAGLRNLPSLRYTSGDLYRSRALTLWDLFTWPPIQLIQDPSSADLTLKHINILHFFKISILIFILLFIVWYCFSIFADHQWRRNVFPWDCPNRSPLKVGRLVVHFAVPLFGHRLHTTLIHKPWYYFKSTLTLETAAKVISRFIIDGPSLCLAVLCVYSKTGFWPSYCQISTDLGKILHTLIVVRNTLVGRLRPQSARGRLQAKTERLCFTCNAP